MVSQRTGIEVMGASCVEAKEHCVWGKGGGVELVSVRSHPRSEKRVYTFFFN